MPIHPPRTFVGPWEPTPWWLILFLRKPRLRRWVECEPMAGLGYYHRESSWEYWPGDPDVC